MYLNLEAANEFRVQSLVIWLANGHLRLFMLDEENISQLYPEEYMLYWKMLCRLKVTYAENPITQK